MSRKGRTKVDLPASSSSKKTSTQDETSFSGPDQLFEDDLVQESTASPPKSKKKEGKLKKAFNNIMFGQKKTKKSYEEESEHVAPSDQNKISVKEKYQAVSTIPCSPALVADVKEVHVANRMPSLETYISPSDDTSLPVDILPQVETLTSCVLEEEEKDLTVGRNPSSEATGFDHTAQNTKDSWTKVHFLPKLKAENKKLSADLSAVEQALKQKELALQEAQEIIDALQAKLNQEEVDHRSITAELDKLKASNEQKEQVYATQLANKDKETQNKVQSWKSKYDDMSEQYKQLEVLARYNFPSGGNAELHSSILGAANQIATFVDGNAMVEVTKERSITKESSAQIVKHFNKHQEALPLVFAIFPAHQRCSSIVLDFTTARAPPYNESESDDEDDFQPVRDALPEDKELDFPQDNGTDADKLRDELKELKVKAEIDLKTHKQMIKTLQTQTQSLSSQLRELSASNVHLKGVIKFALEEAPPSADGVQPGDEGNTTKMLKQFRTKYLELSMQTVEAKEEHQEEIGELKERHQSELTEWQTKFDRKKAELTEKILEKDRQIKEERRVCAHLDVPSTSSLSRIDTGNLDEDNLIDIQVIKAILRRQREEIQSLHIQLQAFQEVSSQREELQDHSKAQSTIVVQLRKDLEAVQCELNVARNKSEAAKMISHLQKQLMEVKVELSALMKEKDEVEDELNLTKQEFEADKQTHHSTRIEVTELQSKTERSQKLIAELGKSKLSLERKMSQLSEERDQLAQQTLELRTSKRTIKGQLEKFGDLQTQVEVTREHVSALAQTIMAKTEENEDLQHKINSLQDDLEHTKFQAFQYEQDFKEERQAREQAVGARHDDFAKFSLKVQTLEEELRYVRKTLESMEAEKEQLNKRLQQAERDFNHALAVKSKELENIKTQLTSQLHSIESESTKYQEQLQRAKEVYLQRQNELLEQIDILRDDAAKQQSELQDKAQIVAEKQLLDKYLKIEKDHNAELNQELYKTKANSDRIANELRDCHQRLETSLADTARLHDEVLAKTAQVKQYKKQTDSFKLKVEESNDRLVKTQKELERCQAFMRTMEEDQQDQTHSLSMQLDTAVADVLAKSALLEKYKAMIEEAKAAENSYRRRLGDLNSKLQHKMLDIRHYQDQLKTLEKFQQYEIYKRSQRRLDRKLKDALLKSQPAQQPVIDPEDLDQHLVQPEHKITFPDDSKIGGGCYGFVYAIPVNGRSCIAKRLQDILLGRGKEEKVSSDQTEGLHKLFIRECVLLSRTKHPNIVQFFGVCKGKDKYDLTLLMERLPRDLQYFIKHTTEINCNTKISILTGISSGLLYLHEECSMVHRDLTAANILLTADNKAKIADFGVARIVTRNLSELSKIPGTLAYMPPEALRDSPTYNESLDIFSYGVLALYLVIQEFPEYSWENIPDRFVDKGESEIHRRRKWLKKIPQKQPDLELEYIITWCLADNALERPSTACLNIILEELRMDYLV